MGVTVFGTGVAAVGALVTLGPAGPIAAAGILVGRYISTLLRTETNFL